TPDRKAQKRAEAATRQQSYARRKPLEERRSLLEREIETLDSERKTLEAWLATPLAYTEENRDTLKEKLARQGELTWQLARRETEWLDLCEELEKLETGSAGRCTPAPHTGAGGRKRKLT